MHPPASPRRPTDAGDDELVERICAVVSGALDLPADSPPLAVDARFHGQGLGLDSIDALRLVAGLEEAFDITIPDAELTPSTFECVVSLVDLVRRLTR